MARQYGLVSAVGVVFVNDTSPRQFGIAGTFLDATCGQIKVWNGSAWFRKPIKVWSGSAWVVKPLKRWNGTAFIVTT